MFASRQQAFFDPSIHKGEEQPLSMHIAPVTAMRVPHLTDVLPSVERYPNKIVRTKLEQVGPETDGQLPLFKFAAHLSAQQKQKSPGTPRQVAGYFSCPISRLFCSISKIQTK